MKNARFTLLSLLILTGCGRFGGQSHETASLTDARRDFKTKPVARGAGGHAVDAPPPGIFRTVKYPSPGGNLSAYLTPDPKDKKKRPAIIWITGGDCNSIDRGCWTEGPVSNDQSASAFRKAGIIMMFPSLRGGCDNPGVKEGFFGEVNDVLAAADFLAKQDYVDPGRIYLGGHSTGGTLVMLVAASSDRFRAVFSFGPVDDVSGYPPDYLPFDTSNRREIELRSPGRWLHSIKSPTFVLEGATSRNITCLETMSRACNNSMVHFHTIKGADHFSTLAPTTSLIAGKILRDDGATTNITLTEDELKKPLTR
jgi:dipeptidyl aminopeptidase/acylaminoacyl peptidase